MRLENYRAIRNYLGDTQQLRHILLQFCSFDAIYSHSSVKALSKWLISGRPLEELFQTTTGFKKPTEPGAEYYLSLEDGPCESPISNLPAKTLEITFGFYASYSAEKGRVLVFLQADDQKYYRSELQKPRSISNE